MLGALAGLQASHDRGVVHRDIKPHNMLMTLDGIVKITDFGIAHMQEDERSFTKTGAVMGTLAYMPPEQRQSAKGLGPTADIFAAGASLFALMTGKEPFDLYNEALHPKLFEGVPEALRLIVAKSCSYEPDARYHSASEMSVALYEALRSLGVQIAPDYRVAMPNNPEGTVFFDGGTATPQGHSVPAGAVESTTINPKETWFTTSGERIGEDPTFATMNPEERPSRKLVMIGFMVVLAVVGSGVAMLSMSSDSDIRVEVEAPPPAVQQAATALQEARAQVEVVPQAPEQPEEMPTIEPPEKETEVVVAEPVAPVEKPKRRTQRATPRPVVSAPPPPPEPEPVPTVTPVSAPTPTPDPVVSPTPEVVVGPTMLSVMSIPRSSVTIDGRGMGQTWVRNVELTPGNHRVVWQLPDGTPPKSMTVSVEAGAHKVVCWSFTDGAICPRR
jgi:hypothetical protein